MCIEWARAGHSGAVELGLEANLSYGCTELGEEDCDSVRRSSMITDEVGTS